MSNAQRDEEIKAGVERMHADGGGAWDIDTFTFEPSTVAKLFAAADAGDAWAATTLAGISSMADRALSDNPLLCFACDTVFGEAQPPAYIVRMRPACDDPTVGSINAICHKCAALISDESSLAKMIERAAQQHFSQSARMVEMHDGVGHA